MHAQAAERARAGNVQVDSTWQEKPKVSNKLRWGAALLSVSSLLFVILSYWAFTCRDIKQIVTQTETFFRNCYNKDIQDYASIMIYTTKQNLRKYCGKQGSRTVRDLLKLAPCANKYVRPAPQPMDCLNEFINKTAQLVNIKPDKVKIPHTCWWVNVLKGVDWQNDDLIDSSCAAITWRGSNVQKTS